MSEAEFAEWLADWSARFPDAERWLSGLETTERTRDAWYAIAFCTFTLAEALQASENVHRGEYHYRSFDWQNTPQIWRQAVVDIRLADTEAKKWDPPADNSCFMCEICHGGLVYCKPLGHDWGQPIGLACTCPLGDRWAKWHIKSRPPIELPRYDPRIWTKVS